MHKSQANFGQKITEDLLNSESEMNAVPISEGELRRFCVLFEAMLREFNLNLREMRELMATLAVKEDWRPDLRKDFSRLTPKEIRICELIREGLSVKLIAEQLHCSARTIETHRSHVRKKLGLTHKKLNLASYLRTQ